MLSKTIVGDSKFASRFRTLYLKSGEFRCCMSNLNSESDWKLDEDGNVHWIKKKDLNTFDREKGNYITMVVNLKQNTITLYQEGDLIGTTTCSNKWLTSGGLTDNTIPFTIGLLISGATYTEYYSKMSLYTCRLYNKVLTDSEVKENYNQTVAYHNMLVNN